MTNMPYGDENSKLPAASASSAAVVAYKGVPVMTTERLAQGYRVTPKAINDNFQANKSRYREGRDFFLLKGGALAAFKNLCPENSGVQISPMTRSLYLWTERGALRHCKSIGTDEAWSLFDDMSETYFAVKVLEKTLPKTHARELYAASRLISTVLSALPNLGDDAKQSLISTTTEMALGRPLLPLPVVGKEWTTSDLAEELGTHPIPLGRKVTEAGLKVPENGKHRLSKSLHSVKQVPQWYWNARGRAAVLSMFGRPAA